MTIHLIDGFKSYGTSADIMRRWSYKAGVGGALDAEGVLLDGTNLNYMNTHIPPSPRIRLGFDFKTRGAFAPTITNSSFLHLCRGDESNFQNQIGLGCNPNGTISVFRGQNFSTQGGETIANSTFAMALETFYWIEMDVVFHPTAGSVEIRVDGNTVVSLSNINTTPIATPWIEIVSFTAGAGTKHVFNNVYIGDGTDGWLGKSTVQLLPLTGDSAQLDFTPSAAGNHYSLVADKDAASSYVETTKVGAADIFTVGGLPVAADVVHAVQVVADGYAVGGLSASKAIGVLARKGGATGGQRAGRAMIAGGLWSGLEQRRVMKVAPDGSAWGSAVTGLEVGVKVPSFARGFNFRATAGYVNDDSFSTYVLNDVYPTTRNGITFGWNSAGSGTVALDRYNGGDAWYAGINCQENTGVQRTFTVDLPQAGRYQVRLLIGDYTYPHSDFRVELLDGATSLKVINRADVRGADAIQQATDAQGLVHMPMAKHREYNQPIIVQVAGTKLGVKIGTAAASQLFSCLGSLEIIALDDPIAPATVADTTAIRVRSVFAEALTGGAIVVPPAPSAVRAFQMAVCG